MRLPSLDFELSRKSIANSLLRNISYLHEPIMLGQALDSPQVWDYVGTMQWRKSTYPGVRYREHPSRKMRNGQCDRYFAIRYRQGGKNMEEALGWASEGWNAEKAHGVMTRIKENIRTGLGPQSLADMRAAATVMREAAEAEKAAAALDALTLAEFFDEHYLPRARREKRTWNYDAMRFSKRIRPVLGGLPLRTISTDVLQRFVDGIFDEGSAPATVRQYLALVRRIYNIAAKTIVEGEPVFAGLNPARDVSLPEVRNARERFLTGQEAELLVSEAAKLASPDLHDAILLSLNTGLRLGEIRRLTWLDCDLINGLVTVRDEARRKPGGTVPLNEASAAVLKGRRRRITGNGLVFPPIFGKDLRENLTHEFRRLADRLDFNQGVAENDRQKRVVFHTLRHTFASWLALAGVDIYRIKTLMRHKTLAMTMRYAHLIPDATREAVHNLAPPKDG